MWNNGIRIIRVTWIDKDRRIIFACDFNVNCGCVKSAFTITDLVCHTCCCSFANIKTFKLTIGIECITPIRVNRKHSAHIASDRRAHKCWVAVNFRHSNDIAIWVDVYAVTIVIKNRTGNLGVFARAEGIINRVRGWVGNCEIERIGNASAFAVNRGNGNRIDTVQSWTANTGICVKRTCNLARCRVDRQASWEVSCRVGQCIPVWVNKVWGDRHSFAVNADLRTGSRVNNWGRVGECIRDCGRDHFPVRVSGNYRDNIFAVTIRATL